MSPYEYYGLTFNPFDKQLLAEKDSFASRDFKEAINRLNHLTETRGIGVLTARPGMGKSFVIRCFAKDLNPNLFELRYICLSTVSVSDFYKQMCSALGVPVVGSKAKMFAAIKAEIYDRYKNSHRPLVFVIDEAQYLDVDILNDLKMLMNFNYDALNCFSIVLCGESRLLFELKKSVHEALRQRITVHYDFQGLSADETGRYIHHKIERANGSSSIIDDNAVTAVAGWAQGNPRSVDNALSYALVLGAQLDRKTIDTDIIASATQNLNLSS